MLSHILATGTLASVLRCRETDLGHAGCRRAGTARTSEATERKRRKRKLRTRRTSLQPDADLARGGARLHGHSPCQRAHRRAPAMASWISWKRLAAAAAKPRRTRHARPLLSESELAQSQSPPSPPSPQPLG